MSVDSALDAFARGELVVVLDAADRENEGDLIMAADRVTPEAIAFMIRYTSGLLCVPLTGERLDALDIPLMVATNSESMRTAFTVSVDAKRGTTTGISAHDRTATVRALAAPTTRPDDLARPGHVFPLRYHEGGVLARPGHTEAAVDLARLSGRTPAGVLAEVTNDDGSMARGPQLERFATEHRLDLISIADLIAYRRQREAAARSIAISRLPTDVGDFEAHVFTWGPTNVQHVALVYGEVRGEAPVLVRVHSACLTGDVFGSLRCDCDARLGAALRAVARAGRGVVVYLRDANLQLDHRVDGRDVRAAAAILSALGVRRIRLLTNNSEKCAALASTDGLDVVEGVPLPRT